MHRCQMVGTEGANTIWHRFQAVKQDNAEQSGIDQLALVISVVVSALASGALVVFIGYYNQFLILGSICTSIGSGLLTTLQPSTSIATT